MQLTFGVSQFFFKHLSYQVDSIIYGPVYFNHADTENLWKNDIILLYLMSFVVTPLISLFCDNSRQRNQSFNSTVKL